MSSTGPHIRPLVELSSGQTGCLKDSLLDPEDTSLLAALGLEVPTPIRLCQAGGPWIVQARGCRIGLTDALARRLLIDVS